MSLPTSKMTLARGVQNHTEQCYGQVFKITPTKPHRPHGVIVAYLPRADSSTRPCRVTIAHLPRADLSCPSPQAHDASTPPARPHRVVVSPPQLLQSSSGGGCTSTLNAFAISCVCPGLFTIGISYYFCPLCTIDELSCALESILRCQMLCLVYDYCVVDCFK